MDEAIAAPTLPKVQIIKDGKAVDTSAIDDYDGFMAFLMQASMAANMAKVRKYFDDRTSIGETTGFDLSVTPTVQEVKCITPAQSIHIVNDGPGQIFVTINERNRFPTPLFAHDEYSENFETHKLSCFYLWSAPGTTARTRATVKY